MYRESQETLVFDRADNDVFNDYIRIASDQIGKNGQDLGIDCRKYDFTEFLKLSDKYETDPDFWESCYVLNLVDNTPAKLLEFVESGIASPYFYFLLLNRNGKWLLQKSPEKLTLHIDRAIACEPDNSAFFYVKAWYLAETGDFAGCKEVLSKGNRTKKNCRPLDYLSTTIINNCGNIDDIFQKAAGAYVLFRAYDGSPELEIKLAKLSCMHLREKFDADFADELVTFAKRVGQMERQSYEGVMWSFNIANSIFKSLIRGCVDPDSPDSCVLLSFMRIEFERQRLNSAFNRRFTWDDNDVRYFDNTPFLRLSDTWSYHLASIELVKELQSLLDCLDPSPFVMWASTD